MSDQVWWYATRAAGLMTWSTAIGSVVVGLLLSTRAIKSRTGPWMLDLHRFLGGLSVAFLAVHLITLYFDSFVDFGPRELFIPGESTWNSEAAAWGIISMYTLVIVEVTSLIRKHLTTSVWRTLHMLSIVTAISGTYHAILGGSDVDHPLTWVIAGAGTAIVIALVALRLKAAQSPTFRGTPAKSSSDREALLMEMRDRLETLPVSADAPQAEVATTGSELPRRSPSEALASIRPVPGPQLGGPNVTTTTSSPTPERPASATVSSPPTPMSFLDPAAPAPPLQQPAAATPNPFASDARNSLLDGIALPQRRVAEPFPAHRSAVAPATPPPSPAPPPTAPVDGPSPSAPTGTGPGTDSLDPFAPPAAPAPFVAPPEPSSPSPSPSPDATTTPTVDPFAVDKSTTGGRALFGAAPRDERPETSSALPTAAPFAAPAAPTEPDPRPTAPTDPFAAAVGSPTDPFATASIAMTVPPVDEKPVPPPVPNAVDPATGEPDEAAYTAWLVEWLAYAEKYGEEAPEDPSRVG
ncbi:MAG: ferric reductase-like transmembrane domain-containing protein [Actinomycetota bacterium]